MPYSKSSNLPEKLIRTVMCIGVPNGPSFALVPFFSVDFYKHNQRTKRVLINWTYGEPVGNVSQGDSKPSGEIKFDAELGRVKLLQLQHLLPERAVEVRFMLPSERGRNFSERIREVIEHSADGSRVLFVLPKAVEDKEFYAALSVFVNPDSKEVELNEELMGDPITSLKELELNIESPFIEVDPRQAFE